MAAAALSCTHLNISKSPTKAQYSTPRNPTHHQQRHRHGITTSSTSKHPKKPYKLTTRTTSVDGFSTLALVSALESGPLEDALQLFEKMPHSNTFVWNVVIRGLVDNGYYQEAIGFYYRMVMAGVKLDHFTYPFVIKACAGVGSLVEVRRVHTKLIKSGLDQDVYVANSLISTYAKLGCIELAEMLFRVSEVRDQVSWNSIIGGCVAIGDGFSSLMYLQDMQSCGVMPDRFSLISALSACALECLPQKGKEVHCLVLRNGFEMDEMIQTSVVDMYSKCGRVDCAEKFFDSLPGRSLGAWNAIIGGYASNGCPLESLSRLRKLHEANGLVDDTITLINVLLACAQLGALLLGKSVHGLAMRKGFLPHLVLETALINCYGECGRVDLAELMFSRMTGKSLVSWNAMLAAYVQAEEYKEALAFFQDMWASNVDLDEVTVASILPSYAEVGSLIEGKQIHGYVAKLGLSSNTYISNALVYMYAKCGDLGSSMKIFERIVFRDVVSWNTIIMAHALHGFGEDSLRLFSQMKEDGIKPNESTFVSLLTSCSVAGMVDEGWKYFHLMREEYNIDAGIEHYGCMLDLLGRSGDLDMARRFVEEMPLAPTARIWGSLLIAARNNKDIALAEYASEHILQLQSDHTGCYVLLSNMYAEAGRGDDVERIKRTMKQEGMEKTAACSMVDVNGGTHQFFSYDKSHEETNNIYDTLDIISKQVDDNSPGQVSTRFRPLEESQKRARSAKFHGVRLAICFGLISSTIGSPILVRKNVRMCEDCHNAAKRTSEFTKREIVVGDSKIFHHFMGGRCSCGDYW